MSDHLNCTTHQSPAMQQMCKELASSIQSTAPILFWGETGSGMSFYAKALHRASRTGKFVTIPCFSLDETTVQQQFLGIEDRSGWLEEAQDGTIFLKRLSEASLAVQQTFLHLLDTQTSKGVIEFSRKGTTETLHVNVRVIYSCAIDPTIAIQEGILRHDFVNALRTFGKLLRLPPLRERREDLPTILEEFLGEFNSRYQQNVSSVDPQALALLTEYQWPGNVRELRNVLEALYAQHDGLSSIAAEHLPEHIAQSKISDGSYFFQLREKERFVGQFLTPSLRIQKDSSKFRIKTSDLVEILRVEDTSFAPPKLKHFEFILKDGSQLTGQILDKAIEVHTSFHARHRIAIQDLYAVASI